MIEPQTVSMPIRRNEDALPDGAVLVVGGGVAGMRASIDLAEAGLQVILIESLPSLGGRVAQLGFMFPTHDCVLCRGTSDHGYGCTRPAISPGFLDHNLHPNIKILTNTEVIAVEGQAGDFTVHLHQNPRYVDLYRCINCGLCTAACPVSLPSDFQMGLSRRKAIYKVAPRAIPDAYVVDKGPYCQDCNLCADICPTGAVNLNEKTQQHAVHVSAIILAVGYSLTNLNEYEEYGWGRYANVLHSMQYERLASRSGPTEGIVARPSDKQLPRRIAWVQCVGSRDQKYPYCSSICCMYAAKEAMLARQRLPNVECTIFSMDERAFNKEFFAYYHRVQEQHGVRYVRCRISGLKEDPLTKNLKLHYLNSEGELVQEEFDMVVLSVGTQPPAKAKALAEMLGIELNPYGFCQTDKFSPLQTSQPGVYVCGTFQSPKEIAETFLDATGAAGEVIRLMNSTVRAGRVESSREFPFLSANGFGPECNGSNGQEPRVGVYVCRCSPSIDGILDTGQIIAFAKDLPGVVHATGLNYGCFEDERAQIKEFIKSHRLNRVVVAGCSHRTYESLFQRTVREAGLNPYLLEMVNIREHCAWVHHDYPEAATRKAKEQIRMAVSRARTLTSIYKETLTPARRALIIGGGVAGMTAALTIADSGFEVTLVERAAELGGNLRHIYYVAEGDNPQRLLRDLVNRVRGHDRIAVLTRTEVIAHEGSVGNFRSVVQSQPPHYLSAAGPTETSIHHSVTIVATGGQEWRGEAYLLGQDERVMTAVDLEERLVHRPEEITGLKEVVMIQCVRDPAGPDYCSRICCTNTMKNAIRIKLLNPDCKVTVLYKDIITYGFREQYYTEARRRGVIFVRYNEATKPQVSVRQSDGQLQVTAYEPVLQKELNLSPDLLVLNMAIVPAEGIDRLAALLGVPLSSEGFFMEAHLKMRPMDFMREGIFLCGMAHYPKFLEDAIATGQAAAGRAISILDKTPLYIGGAIAVVDQEKCVGCLTCVRTCPFSIPQIQSDRTGVGNLMGAAYIDPAQCQGCGTCTAECPAEAIQLMNYHDKQIFAQGLGAWQVAV
jgi:heterodisulfide reductase subunit A